MHFFPALIILIKGSLHWNSRWLSVSFPFKTFIGHGSPFHQRANRYIIVSLVFNKGAQVTFIAAFKHITFEGVIIHQRLKRIVCTIHNFEFISYGIYLLTPILIPGKT